jgi:hypothetical protein
MEYIVSVIQNSRYFYELRYLSAYLFYLSLSRQCGILNISQPYRPTWPVTGIALLYFY